MENQAAYLCVGFLFVILIILFAVSTHTSKKTQQYCQDSWAEIKKKTRQLTLGRGRTTTL